MSKELKRLEKELYNIEVGFLKSVKDKNSNHDGLWKEYQNMRRKIIKLNNYEHVPNS